MGDIKPISKTSYYLREGEAIVSFSDTLLVDGVDKGCVKRMTPPGGKDQIEIMTWGKDNNLPQVREELVTGNNIVPALIERKRNILTGSGLMAFEKRYEKQPDGSMRKVIEEVQMPTESEEWFAGNGWTNGANFFDYLDDASGELVKHSLLIPEVVRLKGGKIGSVEVKECKYMRAGKKNAGRIEQWYWSGHWGKNLRGSQIEEKKTVPIPVYKGEDAKQAKFILTMGDFLFNDGYYPIPTWWGSKDWIEMANGIAPFHKANLTNGYNIRWHVKMPAQYFLDYEKYQACVKGSDEEKQLLKDAEDKKQAFMDDVNEYLAGVANAGRALFTEFVVEEAGKVWPGIEIIPLNYDMKDEALLKLFELSQKTSMAAQGVHPTLANIETQGRLSSGTEIRNAFLMWLIINTEKPRRHMLAVLDLVKKANGWPTNVFYGIRDYELSALATDPSGMQEREKPLAE